MAKIIFVGLDVDDNKFHGCAINETTGEMFEFSCAPTAAHFAKKLEQFIKSGYLLKVCYEATYLGFSLARELQERGIDCSVIAPSLVPKQAGQCVKTDRLDSRRLAEYFMRNLLTIVHQPDVSTEANRDLLRSRAFLVNHAKSIKLHILSLCRRNRINYQRACAKTSHWTAHHRTWLAEQITDLKEPSLKKNIQRLLLSLSHMEQQIQSYEEDLREIAKESKYQKSVEALECFRGIATLTAMTLIFELGDIRRFDHPKRLTSYAGLDIREYSSGGHERKFGISKLGNPHLRTTIIGASQLALKPVNLSRALKRRRLAADPIFISIADRCMARLSQKSYRLRMREKPNNKIKVACAREMLGFIWEALRQGA